MMLAFVCALSLAPSGPKDLGPDTVALPSRDLGTFTEKVPDPSGNGEVETRVRYRLEGTIHLSDPNDGVLIGTRSVLARAESPVSVIVADQLEAGAGAGRTFEEIARLTPGLPEPARTAAMRGDMLGDQMRGVGSLLEGPHPVTLGAGAQPGGWTRFEYGSKRLTVTGQYQINREYTVGNSGPVVDSIRGNPLTLGYVNRFDPNPVSQKFYSDPVPGTIPDIETIEVLKDVGVGALYGSDHRLLGLSYLPTRKFTYPIDLNVGGPKYGQDALGALLNTVKPAPLTAELLGSVNLSSYQTLLDATSVGGTDMNSLQWKIEPMQFPNCIGEATGSFPGGTLWIPDKPGYQTMTNWAPVQMRMTFSPFASIDPSYVLEGQFRTHCMNMEQKEPAAGVRYRPYRNNDPVLAGLMDLTAGSRIRGPWDQARLWIYTNKAGLDEINKRLFPEISAAQYLTGLQQIADLGGLEAKDYASKELFAPKLLAGAGMADSTLGWGFSVLERNQGKELASWLGSMPEELSKLLSGDSDDKAHVAKVLGQALNASSSDVRTAALKGLLKKPQGYETLKGQLGSMLPSLYSPNAGEVEAALDAIPLYSEATPREALEFLVSNGANGKIKSKAAALLGRGGVR
ncbi:MAG: hypothetical protein H6534_03070 [Chthonomonadaceae bacterium]|nr:hypothetical protein [Chthonomonadaceae bacterium]